MPASRDEFPARFRSTQPCDKRGSTRREFAKTLAAIAATPLLGPAIAQVALGNAASANPADLPLGIPAEPQVQAPEKPLPEVEALAEVARIQYGKNLTDDQMTEIKRSLSGRFRAAEAMKKIKLANSDEPAFIFSANPQ